MDLKSPVIDVLSQNGGRMKLEALKFAIPSADSGLVDTLGKPLSRSADAKGEIWVAVQIGGLKLCVKHCSGGHCTDGDCPDLHLCKYFLLNKCTFHDSKCKFGHDIGGHNGQILSRYGLNNLCMSTLQLIFRNNRTKETLPEACTFYNSKGGCTKPVDSSRVMCRHLHVCNYFLSGKCRFGADCMRSHDLMGSTHSQAILQSYGILGPTEMDIINCFKQLNTSDSPTSPTQPPSPAHSSSAVGNVKSSGPSKGQVRISSLSDLPPEVCTYNLGGKCNYSNSCRNHHSSLPYQWQTQTGGNWKDVEKATNDLIEIKYCTVSCTNFNSSGLSVDFKRGILTVLGASQPIRRLETVSAAKCAKRLFASEWVWYWEDVNSTWKIYGQKGLQGEAAAIESDQIEAKYQDFLANGDPVINFKTPTFSYTIDFRKMEQTNATTSQSRNVYRRPKEHVTETVLKGLSRRQLKPVLAPSCDVSLPTEWAILSSSESSDYVLVKVPPTGATADEYQRVVGAFLCTMPSTAVNLVERIQNREKWEDYMRMQKKMNNKALGGQAREEQFLFHGTASDKIDAICQQGFDFRVAGMSTGTLYGRGAYFHKDAKYSHSYTYGCKKMFVVKVLVGEYAAGCASFNRPPPKNPRQPFVDLFDSVVDSVTSPRMFVIFDNSQAYPNYLLHYE